MLENIKHSIVLLQIAKNTAHPINGIYQGPMKIEPDITNIASGNSVTDAPYSAGEYLKPITILIFESGFSIFEIIIVRFVIVTKKVSKKRQNNPAKALKVRRPNRPSSGSRQCLYKTLFFSIFSSLLQTTHLCYYAAFLAH